MNDIHCGDCLEFMRSLPDGLFRCILTSPLWPERQKP